jgi:hypothetical protein
LQKLTVVIALLLAGVNCGCASRSATLAQLDGSEPQRLSYGDPMTVQARFTEKVQACWFGGPAPLLQGYRYETASLSNLANVPAEEANTPHIRIFAGESQSRAAFEVEFHSFNDNTLISTRNLSLPAGLAARLKKDVETWIFGDKGCGSPSAPLTADSAGRRSYDASPAAPAQASHFMQASQFVQAGHTEASAPTMQAGATAY